MEFYYPGLGAQFERVLTTIQNDPFGSQQTLGIVDVLKAHYLIADFFLCEGRELGGIGPRDVRLLESALHRPWVEFGGQIKWNDPLDKAATTLFGLIKDHPFHDANKRTALLSLLYLLSKQGRMPTCSKDDFENITVEIAEMKIVKRARYQQLVKADVDAEVKFISHWLRRNTRRKDDREYTITYRELRRILYGFGFVLENPHANAIDIVRVHQRKGLSAIIFGSSFRRRVGRIGYPGDTRQLALGDIRSVRRMCGLTSRDGVDSQSFYHGVNDMTSLLAEYQDNLRRLADR